MFRFNRERILPLFLKQKMPVAELARKAGIGQNSAQRALEGKKVAAPIVAKVAAALSIDPMEFLEFGGKSMLSKKIVTIETDDGKEKAVELSVDDSGKSFTVWSEDDDDIQKAIAKYLTEKKKAG